MKQTHTGIVKGKAYMTGYDKQYRLRETKNYWICQYGLKYRKTDGELVGKNFAVSRLDLTSIKKLDETK